MILLNKIQIYAMQRKLNSSRMIQTQYDKTIDFHFHWQDSARVLMSLNEAIIVLSIFFPSILLIYYF